MKKVSPATIALIPRRELAHIQRLAKRKAERERAFSALRSSLSNRIQKDPKQIGGVNALES